MFRDSWKNLLLIGAVALVLGVFVVWSTQSIGLWRQGPQAEPAQKEEVPDVPSRELSGIEYEFVPPSGKNGARETTEAQVNPDTLPGVAVNKPPKAAPDLSRPIPDSLRPSTKAEMERLVSELKQNPYNAALWSELGLYRKEANDYEGARLAWEFAYELQPGNAVIAENLGVLYGYYLKNGLKSEEFFRAAISLEPKNIHLRLRLFELYRDVFEDKAKARAAIEAALKDNPGNEQLAALLKEL